MSLQDSLGRTIRYLRISVTDRCNFRCLYCMPKSGMKWLPRGDILTYEEIARLVAELAPLGLSKVRITGGEPTIRADLAELIRMLRAIPGIDDLALSTNGSSLVEDAESFARAGLDRVNISVDSLRPERIDAIARRKTGLDPVAAALAAESAGLGPVKLNSVIMRGINDDEIADIARLTLDHPWHVRFIELMPVGEMRDASADHIVPGAEILARIGALGRVSPAEPPTRGNGPARYHRIEGALGTIGVITPLTHTFCDSCNRVRLTADGRLRTCLFGDHEVDLRTPLRERIPLEPFVRRALADKPAAHDLIHMQIGGLVALSQTGG